MQRPLQLTGGFDAGPLFRHGAVLKKAPRRVLPTDHGRIRARAEKRATPAWTTPAELRRWERAVREAQMQTRVRMSLGHLVPLQHPLVCGLHCPANFCIETLEYNMRKGNRYWPDMWGEQEELWNS